MTRLRRFTVATCRWDEGREEEIVHCTWKGLATDEAAAIASALRMAEATWRIKTDAPFPADGLRPVAEADAFHAVPCEGQVEISPPMLRDLAGAEGPEISQDKRTAIALAAMRIAIVTGGAGPGMLHAPTGAVLDQRRGGAKVCEIHRPSVDLTLASNWSVPAGARHLTIGPALQAALLSATVPHAADTGHYARLEVPASASGRAAQRAEFLRRLDEDVALTAAHMESCRLGPEVEALRAMAAR